MTWSAVALRGGLASSSMKTVPVFDVEPLPAPMNEMTWSASGSAPATALIACCRSRMAANETSWGASEKPAIMPLSCLGKSPFGTVMKRRTVATTVATVTT